jgi:hypothetical protein
MSSHHFVKEGQEPALFILEPASFEVAGPLLEWAPMVLVAENALENVLRWGIKIDVVITTDANVEHLALEVVDQEPVEILSHPPDESSLVNGLQHLINTSQSHVNIIASSSDTVFEGLEKFITELHISLIDGEVKWSLITSGKYQKWVEAATKFSIRKKFEYQKMYFDGLNPVNDHMESNAAGLISIRSEQPFWVSEPLL